MKLYDMTYNELETLLDEWGEPRYRAGQIFGWCARGARPADMSNIPKKLAARLDEQGFGGVSIESAQSSNDGSEKYLFRCEDGNAVEGVLMKYKHGNTLCISTQAGCRMGCVFCASGEDGLVRNLTAGEMAGQLYAVTHKYGERVFSNCVLMGCGEPLDNYDNVVKFLRIISDEKGLNMSLRNISLSTCGLVEGMDRLAEEGLPVTLCISLHAPDDAARRQIMPVANKYTVGQVISAAKRYEQKTGRRIIFEYTLINGINDSEQQARQFARATSGIRKHINLIPVNDARGHYQPPAEKSIKAFARVLENMGASATIRRRLGDDIEGACGQLRARQGQKL